MKNNFFLAIFLSVAVISCQTTTPKKTPTPAHTPVVNSPSTTSSAAAEAAAKTPSPVVNNTPVATAPAVANKNKVALILGPGGAGALAHAGVLRALQKRQISVQHVVGIEWGSLVAALYAQNGKPYEVEWKLDKLKDAELPKVFGEMKKLDKFLNENLPGNVESAKVSFLCPSYQIARGRSEYLQNGKWSDVLKKCMAQAPLTKPEEGWVADPLDFEALVAQLRSQGYNVILFSNLLGRATSLRESEFGDNFSAQFMWSKVQQNYLRNLRTVDWVIDISLSNMSMSEFARRKDYAKEAEAQAERAAKMIADKYGF